MNLVFRDLNLLMPRHPLVQPGNQSFIGAGTWSTPRKELAAIRSHIRFRDCDRFRDIISAPDFVKLFGEPERPKMWKRQNIFGNEDELKTAPKNVDRCDMYDLFFFFGVEHGCFVVWI